MSSKKRVHSYRQIIFVVTSVLFLTAIIWIFIVIVCRPVYHGPDTSEWKTGDLFFSVGDSWKSVAVRAITGVKDFEMPDSTPSHCGIIVRDRERIWLVHASTDAKKIVRETPEQYVKKNGSYCIFSKSVPYTLDTVQLKRDVMQLINRNIPFDFEFDHSDTTALYCTELVVSVMEKNGCDIFTKLRNHQYIYPKEVMSICNNTTK